MPVKGGALSQLIDDRDFDERMMSMAIDEDGANKIDVYLSLSTAKGFKPKDDKELHVDLSFVTPCGTYEIVGIPLSSLRLLKKFIREADEEWHYMPTEDIT